MPAYNRVFVVSDDTRSPVPTVMFRVCINNGARQQAWRPAGEDVSTGRLTPYSAGQSCSGCIIVADGREQQQAGP